MELANSNPKVDEVLSFMMLSHNMLDQIKGHKEKNFFALSPEVNLRDMISNTMIQSLDALSTLYQLLRGNFRFRFSSLQGQKCLNVSPQVPLQHQRIYLLKKQDNKIDPFRICTSSARQGN
jgi:hypothetical protein